ncbi:MAG: gamma-glutamyl-gamma-aminobutyrate hydrolase family protein [Deltaproteobacteria bacterium]|nr:gamma-glutamyl-gamma-aminobutyrate hydrolase family protein [Deltaproteobacteria bacterium]
MRPILVVDCYVRREKDWMDNYRRYLAPGVEVVRADEGGTPLDSKPFSAVVVTGSAASVGTPERWQAAVEDLIRDAAERDVPVLGICFGHQLIARALFGAEAVFTRPVPEFGYLEVEVSGGDPLFSGFPARFHPFVSHLDQVRAVPGLQVLARSAACPVHGLHVEGRRIWGVQFHVEMTPEEEWEVVSYRATAHPDLGIDPEATFRGRTDSEPFALRLFGNFRRLVDRADEL